MEKMLKTLKEAKRVALFCHVSPDPDTIGSTLALKRVLKSIGIEAFAFCPEPLAKDYGFLADFEQFDAEPDDKFDLVVGVDVASRYRLGKYEELFKNHNNTLKIDHHEISEDYAKVNFVEICAATAMIVVKIAENLKAKIDEKSASLLYFALCGDTGIFKYNNTTSSVFLTAAKLLELGADKTKIYADFFDKRHENEVKMSAFVLLDADLYEDIGYALLRASYKTYKKFGTTPEECDLSNLPHTYLCCGYKIGAILKEKLDGIHVSLRSAEDYNVAKIGEVFGGGGHKNAAGFVLKTSMKKAEKLVKAEIERYLKEKENVK